MKRILIIGGGLSGLAAAMGAARKLDELGVTNREVAVTLVNRNAWHSIRVRNYERDLSEIRVPLDDVLKPIAVERVEAQVTAIDLARRRVTIKTLNGQTQLEYDRIVLAAGSQVNQPDTPGLAECAFNVDTFDAAARLSDHIAKLAKKPPGAGRYTALVIGAGLTGIEVACELPERLRIAAAGDASPAPPRVILADHAPQIGSVMGNDARSVIGEALAALGIETRTGIVVSAIDQEGATLVDGKRIEADTVVWTAGMRANPLTALFPVERDQWGRIAVDEFLKVTGVANVFAAGDVARMIIDGRHPTVMSCQHARPMGRFAGNNVVCDLLGVKPLALQINWYVTCLDLGPWGAVYTHGWERKVVAWGMAAKRTKRTINCVRIYPPRSGSRREILEAGAPTVPSPPESYR